jgi:hypothetical protein
MFKHLKSKLCSLGFEGHCARCTGSSLTIWTGKIHKVGQGTSMGCQYSLPSPHPLGRHHLHFFSSCQQLIYLKIQNNNQRCNIRKVYSSSEYTQWALLHSHKAAHPYLWLTQPTNTYWAWMEVPDIILNWIYSIKQNKVLILWQLHSPNQQSGGKMAFKKYGLERMSTFWAWLC